MMDGSIVAEIDARLDRIERDHAIAIAFAIESGSRAWGFPSPDSDYDCRFVFIRPRRDYLTLYPRRDVIESELTPVLDVNGWDLGKAIKLLVKGNAVIIEWLTSPIVYRACHGFRGEFLALAQKIASRESIARHYVYLARRVIDTRLKNLDSVELKKLFYALRPAISLRWLRLHPSERVAPMSFPVLCAGADLPADLAACISGLLAEKAVTRELGRGAAPRLIVDVVYSELAIAEQSFVQTSPIDEAVYRVADDFFRHALEIYGPA